MKKNKKLLLFDIDGTLILSGGAGGKALSRAFEELFGIEHVSSKIILDGMTDRAIARILIQQFSNEISKKDNIEKIIDAVLQKYLFYLKEEISFSENFHVLPGILKILTSLSLREEIVLGLATGNIKEGAKIKLSRGNLFDFFSFGGFGCDAEKRTELISIAIKRAKEKVGLNFAREEIFVIGDTHHDIRAGQELGVKTIAVATGSFSSDTLAKYKPSFLIPQFTDEKSFFNLISH